MKAIKSIKQWFEDGNVLITAIHQGYNKNVRVDARTRHRVPDADNFFSQWTSERYANQLAMDNYGKKVSEFNNYKY